MHYRKKEMEELGRLSPVDLKALPKQPVIIALDDIRSMLNVGSAFRTSDAFRIERMLLLGITGKPPHREISKTALGATETVEWGHTKDKVKVLLGYKKQGYKLVAVEQTEPVNYLHDIDLKSFDKVVFIFGNEAFGVSDEVLEICDACVEIPQLGAKHSLNVSVSVGVVLWEWSAKTGAFSRFA